MDCHLIGVAIMCVLESGFDNDHHENGSCIVHARNPGWPYAGTDNVLNHGIPAIDEHSPRYDHLSNLWMRFNRIIWFQLLLLLH